MPAASSTGGMTVAGTEPSTVRGRARVAVRRMQQRRRPTSALPTSIGAYRSNQATRQIFLKIERAIRKAADDARAARERIAASGAGSSAATETKATSSQQANGEDTRSGLQLRLPRHLKLLGMRSCGLGPSGTTAIASLLRAIPSLTRLDVSDNNATAMGASMLTAAARSAGKSLAICTKALIPGYPGSLASVFSEDLPGEQAVRQRKLLAERRAKKRADEQLAGGAASRGCGAGESKEG